VSGKPHTLQRWDESEQLYMLLYYTYTVTMSEYTTILVKKETREKLKALRITKRESYDEIINKLIEKCAR
jgi:hypothetical protein